MWKKYLPLIVLVLLVGSLFASPALANHIKRTAGGSASSGSVGGVSSAAVYALTINAYDNSNNQGIVAKIDLYQNNQLKYSTTAQSVTWLLNAGVYTYTVSKFGYVTKSDSINLQVHTTKDVKLNPDPASPSAAWQVPLPSIYRTQSGDFICKASDANGIASVQARIKYPSGTVKGTYAMSSIGSDNYKLTLTPLATEPKGQWTADCIATDNAQRTATDTDNFQVLNNPPTAQSITANPQVGGKNTQFGFSVIAGDVEDAVTSLIVTFKITATGFSKDVAGNYNPTNGRFEAVFTPGAAAPGGAYQVVAQAKDLDQDPGTSASASFTVDDQPPTVTVKSMVPNPALRTQSVDIVCNAVDPNGVSSVKAVITKPSGSPQEFTASPIGGDDYKYTLVTLATDPTGAWKVACKATDSFQNTATSADSTLTVNNNPPTVADPIVNPTSGERTSAFLISTTAGDVETATASLTVSFTITRSDSQVVQGAATYNSANGRFEYSYTPGVTAPYGAYSVVAGATDADSGTATSGPTTFTVADTTKPAITNCQAVPASPQTYDRNRNYKFSCDVTDNNALDDVVLTFNGTAHSSKAGQLQKSGDNYYLEMVGLDAQTHAYSWSASDTAGNAADPVPADYVIAKASSTVSLTFNPPSPQPYKTAVTAACADTNPEADPALTRNAVDVTATENGIPIALPAGTHDYECSVPETTNYFGATKTDSYIIDKILAQVSLTLNGQANDISLAPGAQLDVSGQTADGDQNPATKPTLSENSTVIGTGATYPFTLTKTWNPGVGTYAYKYDYLDSENYTATSLTRTATVQDTEAPQWSNNKTSPLSPTDYAPGKQYQFNVTWTDNTGVAQVWFSWTSCSDQGCGGYTMPVTTKNGDEYYVDMSDLPAGNYSFSWRAEDAYGNSAITDTWKYLINPADPTDPLNPVLHLSLNGVEADQAVSYGTTSTALGWKDFIEGSLTLFRDGAVVANPEALVLGAELYNYTLYFPGSANYTSGSVERFLTVDQRAPSVIFTITPPSPITYGVATTATCTSPDVQMTLTRDGNDVTGTENGAPVTLTAGTHSYACDYAGNQNFTSYNSEGFYVVNKASTTLYLALDGLEGDKTYNLGQTINAYGWVFLDQSPPLLFVDNDQVATAVENTPGRTNIWYPSVQNAGVHNYTIALNHENYTAAPVTRFATVTDTEAPQWSNMTENPPSPTPYAKNKQYTFSITWTDNDQVASSVFYIGSYVVTPVKSGDVYTATVTDLPVGNYDYYWTAVDNAGNVNNTFAVNPVYAVTKADPGVHVSLNGVESDLTVIYPTETTAFVWVDNGEVDEALYRDGVPVFTNPWEIITLGVGTYNYTGFYPGSANYSAASVERFLTVNKGNPVNNTNLTQSVIHLSFNGLETDANLAYGQPLNATAWKTIGEGTLDLLRDSVLINGENGIYATLPAGFYTYMANFTASANYTDGQIVRYATISRAPSLIDLYFNGSLTPDTVLVQQGDGVNATAQLVTSLPADGTVALYLNGTLLVSGLNRAEYAIDTSSLAFGVYEVNASWTGDANYTGFQKLRYIDVRPELIPPVITITSPVAGSTTGRTVWLNATTDENAACNYGPATDPTAQMGVTGTLNHSQLLSNLPYGSNTYFVKCADPSGNAAEASVTWSVFENITIELENGWNLISLPVVPNSPVLTDDLAIWGTDPYVIEHYNASTASWYVYNSSEPLNANLTQLYPDWGYWVWMANDRKINIVGVAGGQRNVSLIEGLNMVGWTNLNAEEMSLALYYIQNNVSKVECQDTSDKSVKNLYQCYPPAGDSFEQGKGYFITMLSNSTWVYPKNIPPVANAGADRNVEVGAKVTFDGSGSSDSDGTVVSYEWNFGDGTNATGMSVEHTYAAEGVYVVTLKVTDNDGDSASDLATVRAFTPAAPGGNLGGLGGNAPFQYSGLIILSVATPNIQLAPGNSTTVTATIVNGGHVGLANINLSASGVPAGWISINPASLGSLDKGGTNSISITITVPANEQNGTRTVTITANARVVGQNTPVVATDAISVTVIVSPTIPPLIPPTTTLPGAITGAFTALTKNSTAVAAAIVAGFIALLAALYFFHRPYWNRLMGVFKFKPPLAPGTPVVTKDVKAEAKKEEKAEKKEEKKETTGSGDNSSIDFSIDYTK